MTGERSAHHCTTAGCSRVPWNGQPHQPCCRTCVQSSGRAHGPECGMRAAQAVEPTLRHAKPPPPVRHLGTEPPRVTGGSLRQGKSPPMKAPPPQLSSHTHSHHMGGVPMSGMQSMVMTEGMMPMMQPMLINQGMGHMIGVSGPPLQFGGGTVTSTGNAAGMQEMSQSINSIMQQLGPQLFPQMNAATGMGPGGTASANAQMNQQMLARVNTAVEQALSSAGLSEVPATPPPTFLSAATPPASGHAPGVPVAPPPDSALQVPPATDPSNLAAPNLDTPPNPVALAPPSAPGTGGQDNSGGHPSTLL